MDTKRNLQLCAPSQIFQILRYVEDTDQTEVRLASVTLGFHEANKYATRTEVRVNSGGSHKPTTKKT